MNAKRLWLPLALTAAIPAWHFFSATPPEGGPLDPDTAVMVGQIPPENPSPAPSPDHAPDAMRLQVRAASPAAAKGETGPTASLRPSLNAAGPEQIAQVRGFGTKLAGKVIDARPPGGFTGWHEVDAVPGIGAARLQALQDHFSLP